MVDEAPGGDLTAKLTANLAPNAETELPAADPIAEGARVSGMLVDVTVARLEAQLGLVDAYDAKAVAVLTADSIVVAVVAATLGNWGPVWPVPLAGALLSAGAAVLEFRLRTFHRGPDLPNFYEQFGGLKAAEANAQMLADLFEALRLNKKPLESKLFWLQACLYLLAGTLVLAALSFTLWHLMTR